MPTYVVNPNNPASPTNQQGSTQGAEELRALKTLIASLVIAASASSSPRHSIQSAILDANGYNAALTVGAGLRPGLTASAINPYHLSFANGFSGGKALNNDEAIIANNADILGADLPLSNTSFLYRIYGASYGSTLIPPQYGYAFDRTKDALLNFEGIDGAVTTTDDFGNTWTFNGNAQIDTAQFKFGTASLLLDGTGDFISSSSFISLNDSWTVEMFVRFAALPTAGNRMFFYSASVGAANNTGVELSIFNNAGTYNLEMTVSSDATTANVANGNLSVIVPVINTWYHVVITYDALGGSYRTYWDGVAENNVASALRVGAFSATKIGVRSDGVTGFMNGWIDGFRITSACLYPAGITFVPPIIAPSITAHKYHFFNIPQMQMFEITAASAAAGTNPILTVANILFLGEADTSGVAVTAIRNYAIRGEYISGLTTIPAAANSVEFSCNLGRGVPAIIDAKIVNVIADLDYKPGMEVTPLAWNGTYAYGVLGYWKTIGNIFSILSGTTGGGLSIISLTTAGNIAITIASWKWRLKVKRAF